MHLSKFEAVILLALEDKTRSLTHAELSILLQENPRKLTHQELYDYVESLKEKGLVRVNLMPTFRARGFAGLRVTGEGRNTLNALREQQGQIQEPVKNPIGFRRDKD